MKEFLDRFGLGMFNPDNYYALSWWQGVYVRLTVRTEDRLKLFKKIAKYISDGIDLQTTIQQMSEEYLRQNPRDKRGLILSEWNAAMIMAGDDLSDAIEDWVGSTDTMMIKAGEDGGNLVDAIDNLIKSNEDQQLIMSKVKGALGYPFFLMAITYGMMWMSKLKILPAFEGMVPPEDWPEKSAQFRDFTLFVTDNSPLIFGSFAVAVFLMNFSMARVTGFVRNILDKIEPYASYKRVNSSLFLISLSAMMKTGTDVHSAIETLSRYSSPYVRSKLDYILDIMVEQGEDLGEALDENFFDKEVMMDVRLYTKGSVSTEAIIQIGQASIDTTIVGIEKIAGLIRLVMMFAAGGYVLWMMTSSQAVTGALRASVGV